MVRKAKAAARLRHTNSSALIEDLLAQTTRRGAARPASSTRKWTGKFDVRPSDGDPLLDPLKDKYGLADT